MKRVLITGARRGIGLDTAKRLLQEGYTVYATVHKDSDVSGLQQELGIYGEQAIVDKLDILNPQDVEKIASWKIDILINNAAIGNSGPLAEVPVEKLRETFETNVFATLAVTQACIPYMKEQGSGKVIFLSSLAGLMPSYYLAPYGMTKYAVENMGLSMRQELKPLGIDVTLINPGGYHTGFNQKNFAKMDEWFDENGLYRSHLKQVRVTEKVISLFEQKSTASIAKKIVKAVRAKRMRRRYSAPWYQWFFVSLAKRFVV